MYAGNVFLLINDNSDKDYSFIKFQNIKETYQDKLLLIAMKPILFYDGDKFNCKGIKQKKKKHNWLNLFINYLTVTLTQKEENTLTYGIVIEYFCEFYSLIKTDFIHFINEFEKIRGKIDFDLFGVTICFLSYLNKNNMFLDILSSLNNEQLIQDLKIDNDNLRKRNLYFVITDYCILHKIQNIKDEDYESTEDISKRIIKEIKELKCYAELSPITESYKNFLLTLCSCLNDSRDLRINQEKNVVELIELIFIELNLHLRKKNYWEDDYLAIIKKDIYDTSLQYTTDNFDENYIDFVISYILKYGIPTDNFFEYFLKGLDKKAFNKVFKNLNLKENIGELNQRETIIKLFDKIHKKKNSSGINNIHLSNEKEFDISNSSNTDNHKIAQQNEISMKDSEDKDKIQKKGNEIKNSIINEDTNNNIEDKKTKIDDNDIHEEKKDNIFDDDEKNSKIEPKEKIMKESEKEKDKSKENLEFKEGIKDNNPKKILFDFSDVEKLVNNKLEIFQKENEKRFINLEKENEQIKGDNKRITEENKRITEENKRIIEENKRITKDKEIMEQKINSLEKKSEQKDIAIKQIRENCKNLSKELDRISFRDLSKKVLNNMIDFVNKKNNKLLIGLSKRKEKLEKINQNFNFKGIEYMRKPFREICARYYNSNLKSHTPDIATDFHKKPFGLVIDPEESILKSYYETMIDSKDNQILSFLTNELKIKNDIRKLYL